MRYRIIVTFAVAVAVFWIAWPLLWRYWTDTVTSWGAITTDIPWFDSAFLLLWVFMLALVVVVAVIAAVMLRPQQRTLFGILLGVVCGGTAYVRETHFFASDAPVASYVWTYGTYAIAILGGITGVSISRLFGESPPNASPEHTREG